MSEAELTASVDSDSEVVESMPAEEPTNHA